MSAPAPRVWKLYEDFVMAGDSPMFGVALVCQNVPDAWENARLIAAAPELLSIARRWAALDGVAWHLVRHAREREQLLRDTQAVLDKVAGR